MFQDTIFTHNQALTWSTEEELSDKQINVDAIDTQDPELKTPEVRTEPAVNKTFGIVFDAGSTGTRIHVFKLNGGNRGTDLYIAPAPLYLDLVTPMMS